VAAESNPPQPPRPIDGIRIRARKMPGDVAQARLAAAADNAANEEVARPRIDAVLTACKLVAQDLEGLHSRYAEVTDLGLTGYSRASAIWLLSGRSLGLLRALLVQVEAGIGNEAMVTGRALHEANRVLFAFSVPDADDLVRIWLDDEGRHGYVKQGPARAAEQRYEDALAQAMEGAGLTPLESTREKTEELYDRMSRVAHSRRSSCVNSVWEPARQMAYGWHPSPLRRAGAASWAASMTGEVVNSVGDALRALYGKEKFFTNRIVPLRESLEAVRRTAPLDEESIRRAAGTA
jgi:hypothetical protein